MNTDNERLDRIADLCTSDDVVISKEELMWVVGELRLKSLISDNQASMIDSLYEKIREFNDTMDKENTRLEKILVTCPLYQIHRYIPEKESAEIIKEEFERIFGRKNSNF